MITEVSDAHLIFLERLHANSVGVIVGNEDDVQPLADFLRRLGLRDWKEFSLTMASVAPVYLPARKAWKLAALFWLSPSVRVRILQRRGSNRTKVEVLTGDIFVSPALQGPRNAI